MWFVTIGCDWIVRISNSQNLFEKKDGGWIIDFWGHETISDGRRERDLLLVIIGGMIWLVIVGGILDGTLAGCMDIGWGEGF